MDTYTHGRRGTAWGCRRRKFRSIRPIRGGKPAFLLSPPPPRRRHTQLVTVKAINPRRGVRLPVVCYSGQRRTGSSSRVERFFFFLFSLVSNEFSGELESSFNKSWSSQRLSRVPLIRGGYASRETSPMSGWRNLNFWWVDWENEWNKFGHLALSKVSISFHSGRWISLD